MYALSTITRCTSNIHLLLKGFLRVNHFYYFSPWKMFLNINYILYNVQNNYQKTKMQMIFEDNTCVCQKSSFGKIQDDCTGQLLTLNVINESQC